MVFYHSVDSPIVIKKIYCNHVSSGVSKQDWLSVFLIVEGIVMQLKRDFPCIVEVSIQMDNTRYYQNMPLAFTFLIMLKKHKLLLQSYVSPKHNTKKTRLKYIFQLLGATY